MRFSDIIGQDEISQRLARTVKENRVSHAQLFFGPEGSGKLELAIAYAQYINCRNRQSSERDGQVWEDSCGTCPSCVKYQKLAHPDLHFIFPVATNKQVKKDPISREFVATWREVLLKNEFRLNLNDWHSAIQIERKQGIINALECSEILRTLSYTSYESEFKVMIIWMVERLFHAAAPKILKILEEPPDKTLFLLITERPDQIISTILSRTQLVKIPRRPDEAIRTLLVRKHGCTEEQALDLVPLVDGNYNLAVKMLEKNEEEESDIGLFTTWMRHCYAMKNYELLDFISGISRENREKIRGFLAYGVRLLRNALLLNLDTAELSRLNKEEAEFLGKFRAFINRENVDAIIRELEEAQYFVERNANPGILLTDLSLTIGQHLRRAEAMVRQQTS